MKYTRFEYKNINMINRGRAVLKYYIWVPLAVVLIGYIISRFFIVPFMINSNLKTAHTEEKSLPEYQHMVDRKYYIIQMGAFASVDNAKSFTSNLKSTGIPSFINNEGQYFFVIVHSSNSMDYIKTKAEYYQTLGYSCVVKEIKISPADAPDKLKGDQRNIMLSKFYNIAGTIIDECYETLKSYDQKNIDYNAMKARLVEEERKLNEFKDVHGDDSGEKSLIKICELIKGICSVNDGQSVFVELNEKMLNIIYEYRNLAKYTTTIGQ